jgi:putative transposase
VVNRRSDWFWKLAHELTNQFDVLCFETLNLKGMQRLWGGKISDLAFGEFLKILEWVAIKKGKRVVFIDRWYPSSNTCLNCGHVLESLNLSIREWRCPSCQSVNGRDENAAKNNLLVFLGGASTAKAMLDRRCLQSLSELRIPVRSRRGVCQIKNGELPK